MSKILVIEDNPETAAYIEEVLTLDVYMVDLINNGSDASVRLKDYQYDLIIIDWNLPGQTGPEVCAAYRAANGNAPILMLTANASDNHKEFGLDSGADDYLTKPFSLKELKARVRALLRRSNRQVIGLLKCKDIELDPAAFKVTKAGTEIKLLPKEFALLEFFMRNPNQVFTSEQVFHRVWHTDSEAGTDALRSALRRLRQKLGEDADKSTIVTIPGVGFRLDTAP